MPAGGEHAHNTKSMHMAQWGPNDIDAARGEKRVIDSPLSQAPATVAGFGLELMPSKPIHTSRT
jgi:hypothetical protein